MSETNFEKVLVLSTSHLRRETADLLEFSSNEKLDAFRFALHLFTKHTYGYILFVSESCLDENNAYTLFPEIRPVMEYAVKHECTLINYDADAPILEGYETFNW